MADVLRHALGAVVYKLADERIFVLHDCKAEASPTGFISACCEHNAHRQRIFRIKE